MAPPLSSLYTLSFAIATLATLVVAATLRLLAILPNARPKPTPLRKPPAATRVLIVLGSGGHTHEMLYLLRSLDTRKYTHRTYVVSAGDAFSAQRAVDFERALEEQEKARQRAQAAEDAAQEKEAHTPPNSNTHTSTSTNSPAKINLTDTDGNTHVLENMTTTRGARPAHTGPSHYNIAVVPRARNIHQSLVSTPLSALHCLYASFAPLLRLPPSYSTTPPAAAAAAAASNVPDLIITNGPATAVIVILAALLLRFFNVRGASSREMCKTVYVESFARVRTLSLSGKVLVRVVDRFLVQWEELEGAGGRAEYWGVLV